jgi:hypothetical protein
MRSALLLTLSVSCVSICWAQSPTPAQAAAERSNTSASTATGVVEKRTERIHIEDAGSRIDELRVGGETKTIDVQPKGGMPAYQIQPTSGERSWKILGF